MSYEFLENVNPQIVYVHVAERVCLDRWFVRRLLVRGKLREFLLTMSSVKDSLVALVLLS